MDNEYIKNWLKMVKKALTSEGFNDTLFQTQKPDQTFGFVKDIEDVWQMHVRGFKDGHLESEIELRRWFIEHLGPTRRPATIELIEILDNYGIPYRLVGEHPETIYWKIEPPESLTDWRPLAVILVIRSIGLAASYFVTREKK